MSSLFHHRCDIYKPDDGNGRLGSPSNNYFLHLESVKCTFSVKREKVINDEQSALTQLEVVQLFVPKDVTVLINWKVQNIQERRGQLVSDAVYLIESVLPKRRLAGSEAHQVLLLRRSYGI